MLTYSQKQVIAYVATFKNARRIARCLRAMGAKSYELEAIYFAANAMKAARMHCALALLGK